MTLQKRELMQTVIKVGETVIGTAKDAHESHWKNRGKMLVDLDGFEPATGVVLEDLQKIKAAAWQEGYDDKATEPSPSMIERGLRLPATNPYEKQEETAKTAENMPLGVTFLGKTKPGSGLIGDQTNGIPTNCVKIKNHGMEEVLLIHYGLHSSPKNVEVVQERGADQ